MSPSNADETWEYSVLTDNDFELNDKPSIQKASNKKITLAHFNVHFECSREQGRE